MKLKHLLLLICFVGTIPVFAQSKVDTTGLPINYRPGIFWYFTGLTPPKKAWKPRYDRLIFDIKYNDLVNPSDIHLFNTKWNSIGFNMQFIFDIRLAKNNTVSLGLGIGYEFDKYVHNKELASIGYRKYDFATPTTNFDKAILRTNTFFIPVELRFRTKGYQHFKFQIGSNIGYRFGNNKVYSDDLTTRLRTGKMKNFEWLLVDAHVRMGIRNWAIIASTNLLPIFRKTDVKSVPISLGLSISLF